MIAIEQAEEMLQNCRDGYYSRAFIHHEVLAELIRLAKIGSQVQEVAPQERLQDEGD